MASSPAAFTSPMPWLEHAAIRRDPIRPLVLRPHTKKPDDSSQKFFETTAIRSAPNAAATGPVGVTAAG